MKAILISINPKHVANILNGKKTIELRKTYPHCALPIDVYIYCTKSNTQYLVGSKDKVCDILTKRASDRFSPNIEKYIGNGKVVAKFTLKEIREAKYQPNVDDHTKLANKLTCLTDEEIDKYFGKKDGYGWVIDDLEIFDKPKEISEFYGYDSKYKKMIKKYPYQKSWWLTLLTRAPQSWCYVEV